MTARCPLGHESETHDYCDQCGTRLEIPAADVCPRCGAARSGTDQYCESDGYDFLAGPDVVETWEAIVTADRSYFDRLELDDVCFPDSAPTRTFRLITDQIRIGRRSRSQGIAPEIDLADEPTDPGISHVHARLVRGSDGTYAVEDAGSTNGTTMNDDSTPLPRDTPVTVTDGDRIHIGAWTTIRICAVHSTDRKVISH
jgi:hypothetical protein